MNGYQLPCESPIGRKLTINLKVPNGHSDASIEFPVASIINDPQSCRNLITGLHSAGLVEHSWAVTNLHMMANAREETLKRKIGILRRIVAMQKAGPMPIPERARPT
jgi:hypothetical protein